MQFFANPSSEVNYPDEYSSRKLQNKMKRKRKYCKWKKYKHECCVLTFYSLAEIQYIITDSYINCW